MSNDRKVNHMEDMTLEKLIKKRKDWVRLSKENNFDFNSILAGLYNDPSHFIYEILQNAEDERAKEIRFELFEDRLDIYHNGKDFDFKDIVGVTGIGISKKKDDLTAIGKFGVGFKSVFAVTETPYIFSDKYKIKIKDFVIPSPVNNNEQINDTLIRLPFNHRLRSREQVFNLVFEKLANLSLKTLLFLKNIESIQWQTPSLSGNYSRSSKYFQKIKKTKKVIVKSSDVTEEYIVIEKPINIEGKKLKVEVAYKLGKDKRGKKIIAREPNSKLVAFFPTDKPTYLNFIIQGPYKTTPNRENIPLEDKQNKTIIEETVNLVAESLAVIKKLGFLDVNFLNILPLKLEDKENEPIYLAIYQKVRDTLRSEKLLPALNHKYTKADNSLLARGKELTEFLDNKDLQRLFSKHDWLDTNITYDKTRELREYLINELKVEEADFEIFAGKITAEFLQTKSDKWMVDFYKRLLRQPTLWNDENYSPGILRTKPIIRLETGKHIAPFDDNGRIQVYLPTKIESKYKTVKRIFCEDKDSLNFFKELGITKPDLFAEVNEYILPKYQLDCPRKDKEYFEDIEKLLRVYETIPANEKDEFIEELSKLTFIDSVNNITGKYYLRKPYGVYLRGADLKEYFKGLDSVYFVSNKLYKKFGEEKLVTFLKSLEVDDKPRRIIVNPDLPYEEFYRLRNGERCGREDQIDFKYDGLNYFIKHMTAEKSYLLWKLLLKNIRTLNSKEAEEFFEGKYTWFYKDRPQGNAKFEASFSKTLKQHAWLVDKDSNFRKPADISFAELSNGYFKKGSNIDKLVKILGFKSNYDMLADEDRKRLELTKNIPLEDLEKFSKERLRASSETETIRDWTPEYEADESKIPIEEIDPSKIVTPDFKNQEPKIAPTKVPKKKKSITEEEVSAKNKKKIGEHGEKTVYGSLKKEYKKDVFISIEETSNGFKARNGDGEIYEVIWLNRYRESGKGYDLIIKKDGVEIEYIEVKSKVGTEAEFVSVSGTQWEFARRLFNRKEGNKYSFYIVTNTGKLDAKIRLLNNPIKLWREGKLYAHPVNFKL